MLKALFQEINLHKVNYRRYALIAAMMMAMMLAGLFVFNFSMTTFIISGFVSVIWGVALYFHLDRKEKRDG